jgi:hypothetical protein
VTAASRLLPSVGHCTGCKSIWDFLGNILIAFVIAGVLFVLFFWWPRRRRRSIRGSRDADRPPRE